MRTPKKQIPPCLFFDRLTDDRFCCMFMCYKLDSKN